jgi:hypothetical protein
VQANGSSDGGADNHSLRRVTSGRMMLGIRSSGPGLSVAINPSIMQYTTGDQLRALVNNYANWNHGPPAEDKSLPPDQRKSPEEADAYFERVRRENLLAHCRYSYQFSGFEARTEESGSDTVMYHGEPALELDAVSRKFRLLFHPFFSGLRPRT